MDGSDLFDELLDAEDRDRCPGARAVISLTGDEPESFLRRLEECERSRVRLRRRGVEHGVLAVLDRVSAPSPRPLGHRWKRAEPVFMSGIHAPPLPESAALFDELRQPHGLGDWLRRHIGDRFRAVAVDAAPVDPERDVERVGLEVRGGPRDLWCKSTRLSTHPDDGSLRLRFSAGLEVRDDARRDAERDGWISALAEACLPGCAELHRNAELWARIEAVAGEPLVPSHHIGYWNAAGGGALFHHDAFDEPYETRQRGVLFVQLDGRTAWLALSLDDLGARVREFAEWMAEDGERFPAPELLADPRALGRELALPGGGRLGGILNGRADFTGLLADAGHALVLEPGEALLLPNHGLSRTAMHSVFCADDRTTYGVSMGLFARGETVARPPPKA